jgi:Phospholipase_D-nuclease N-terminal
MELLTPEIGLLAWTTLSLLYLVLCVLAMFKLARNKTMQPGTKLIWLLAILFVPFAGSIIYLALRRNAALSSASE